MQTNSHIVDKFPNQAISTSYLLEIVRQRLSIDRPASYRFLTDQPAIRHSIRFGIITAYKSVDQRNDILQCPLWPKTHAITKEQQPPNINKDQIDHTKQMATP